MSLPQCPQVLPSTTSVPTVPTVPSHCAQSPTHRMLLSILFMGWNRRRGSPVAWMNWDTSCSIWGHTGRPGGPRNLWGPAGSCPEMPSDACPPTHPFSELNLLALVLLLQLLHASSLFWGGQGGSGRRGPPPKTRGGHRGRGQHHFGAYPNGAGAWPRMGGAARVTRGAPRGKGQGRGHCGGVARRPPHCQSGERARAPGAGGGAGSARGARPRVRAGAAGGVGSEGERPGRAAPRRARSVPRPPRPPRPC